MKTKKIILGILGGVIFGTQILFISVSSGDSYLVGQQGFYFKPLINNVRELQIDIKNPIEAEQDNGSDLLTLPPAAGIMGEYLNNLSNSRVIRTSA